MRKMEKRVEADARMKGGRDSAGAAWNGAPLPHYRGRATLPGEASRRPKSLSGRLLTSSETGAISSPVAGPLLKFPGGDLLVMFVRRY